MSNSRRLPAAIVACLLLVSTAMVSGLSPSATAQESAPVTRTTIRFVHAVPDLPSITIAIDGVPVVENVEFGAASENISIEPGDRQIDAIVDAAAVATGNPGIDEGSSYIVTFLGQIGDIGVKVNEVKLDALDPGRARIRAINASPDAGELTFRAAGGDTLFDGVEFEEDTAYEELDAGAYVFDVTGPDDVALASVSLDLQAGRVTDLVALGVVGAGTFALLPITTNVSPPCSETLGIGAAEDACIRVVHGDPALGNADAAIGGSLIAWDLPFGEATTFVPVLAGDEVIVTFVPTGVTDANDEPLTIALKAGQAYILVAWSDTEDATATADALQNMRLDLFEVNLTPLPDDQTRLRVIQSGGDVGAIDLIAPSLGEQSMLFAEVAEGSATEYEVLDAGSYPLEIHYAGESAALFTTELDLQAGVAYDAVALGNAGDESFMLLVLLAPTETRSDTATPISVAPAATPEIMD